MAQIGLRCCHLGHVLRQHIEGSESSGSKAERCLSVGGPQWGGSRTENLNGSRPAVIHERAKVFMAGTKATIKKTMGAEADWEGSRIPSGWAFLGSTKMRKGKK